MSATPERERNGVYKKFVVTRTDGRSEPGEKHETCRYFVLDLDHDEHAFDALAAYADSCEIENPVLASDLRQLVRDERLARGLYDAGWER